MESLIAKNRSGGGGWMAEGGFVLREVFGCSVQLSERITKVTKLARVEFNWTLFWQNAVLHLLQGL